MGKYVLQNCKLYLGGYDLSADMNQLAIDYSAQEIEKTVFDSGSVQRVAGLLDFKFNHRGLYEAGTDKVDEIIWNKFATVDEIMTVCPTDGAAGETAFSLKGLLTNYAPGAAVGELFAFDLSGSGTVSKLIRGTIMETGAKTTTGTGTARQLGAVGENQKLYAVMHVLAVSGTTPTIDMVVQSDDAEGFASPTDRITFNQVTEVGAQWATPVSGPITDNWWRLSWTIGGTDPSFTVVVLLAIQ